MIRTVSRGDLIAISAGYVSSGIAFGALATALGVPLLATVALSAFVYSGAVQSAFVGFWSIGIDPVSLFLTAFLLNLRHTFYGPHVGSMRSDTGVRDILSISPLLTDEVYAISVSLPPITLRSVKFLSLYAYANWIGSTIVGIVALDRVPAGIEVSIAIALPALFLALLVPKIGDSATAVTAIGSGTVAVVTRLMHLASYFVIVSIISGVAIGLITLELKYRK